MQDWRWEIDNELQGHRGRGVWRCLTRSDVLITGGADSSIKIYHLPSYLRPCPRVGLPPPIPVPAAIEEFVIRAGAPKERQRKEDSEAHYEVGEQVRCMAINKAGDSIYCATSRGRLHLVALPSAGLSLVLCLCSMS